MGKLGIGCPEVWARASPTFVEGVEGVVEISCGWNHSVALLEDGRVFGWGAG